MATTATRDAGRAAAAAAKSSSTATTNPDLIWFNGKLVPWESATVHVMTHALHYGSSVFEGMRCYDTPRGPAIFRAREHVRRMRDSARLYRMELPDEDDLLEACRAVVRENDLKSAYIRPLAWRGVGSLSVNATRHPVEIMIAALPWGAYLGEDALEQGVDVCVSSWTRPAANTIPTGVKAGGNYLSGQLIAMEAERLGFAEGIALDTSGMVSEGSGENLFLVRDGVIVTPPASSSILPGITRDTVITLAREEGLTVREERIPREALYAADEAFFTGTAVEVTPVRSVDGVAIGGGMRGPITARLQRAFFAIVRGEAEDRRGWLTTTQ
jgi:branched-chain amino acid aminotransferase